MDDRPIECQHCFSLFATVAQAAAAVRRAGGGPRVVQCSFCKLSNRLSVENGAVLVEAVGSDSAQVA